MSTRRPLPRRHQVFGLTGTLKAAILAFEELNTPRALSCAILIGDFLKKKGTKAESQGFESLKSALSLEFDPLRYDLLIHGLLSFNRLADRVSRDYLATKMLSKLALNIPGVDRRGEALKRFLIAEDRCGQANFRFSHSGMISGSKNPDHARFLEISFRARKKVIEILGRLDLDTVVKAAGYGPGVTLESRNRPCLPAKISTTVVYSPSSWRLLSHLIGASPLLFEATTGIKPDGPCCTYGNQVHEDDELTFVPKTWKTDRSICIGSSAAIYVQKGIGRLIRRKLKRAGVDLDDQSTNQVFAEKASVRGDLATVDLESASDSISRGLVRFLLPAEWYELLESVRSKWTRMPDGSRLFLNKFSAMGNGYTFELESLIFYALTLAFCEESGVDGSEVTVYGDDIICPTSIVNGLTEFFAFCGFAINREKTFSSGYFRESCGKDFIHGLDVRPFFIKRTVDQLEDFFKLGNQIRTWNLRGYVYRNRDVLHRVFGCIYHSVDSKYRYLIPPSFPGDAGFHSSKPPTERKSNARGYDGWWFRYWSAIADRQYVDTPAALAARMLELEALPRVSSSLTESISTGNEFARRARDPARRASRMGYTYDWA